MFTIFLFIIYKTVNNEILHHMCSRLSHSKCEVNCLIFNNILFFVNVSKLKHHGILNHDFLSFKLSNIISFIDFIMLYVNYNLIYCF